MEDITITRGDWRIGATCSGPAPQLVMLHPGLADRRVWFETMRALKPVAAVAYDRRGFGQTPPATEAFRHVDDLEAVLDACVVGPAVVVGNSQGGRIAIDFALEAPERVAGLVLIAPAISGDVDPDWAAELGEDLAVRIEAAEEVGDLDLLNELEARVWLDGLERPPGAVGGGVRDLFLEMNGIALRSEGSVPPLEPPPAVNRLHELAVPVLILVGALDLRHARVRSAVVADCVPNGRLVELSGVAHLPNLEQPHRVAEEIERFVAAIQV